MVYKILITSKIKPEQPISHQSFLVQLTFTNIGESTFPGGELTNFTISATNQNQYLVKSALPKIPPIKPNEKLEEEPHSFRISTYGIAWVKVNLKADDGEQVDHYQSLGNNLGKDWMDVISIRNQEYVTIISLLKKIVKLLERTEKQ